MKKFFLIIGCVISLFILVSLSYQPIIAEKSIIEIKKDVNLVEDEDCGCNPYNIDWDFPIICWILEMLWYLIPQFSPFPVPLLDWVIIFINEVFDCPNIP